MERESPVEEGTEEGLGDVLEVFGGLTGMLVGNVCREGQKCILFPSLTVRSSGGLVGVPPCELGILR